MINLAELKIGRLRYNSPWTQVCLVGFVAFSSVGMHSAVNGLGGGGLGDVRLSDIANSVLYACFFVSSFFSGSVNNILGPRFTMALGTSGYALYLGALWNYHIHGTRWFVIFAGAFLGVTASLFWSAQGSIMMSYPLEKDKGRSFTAFWVIFQLGALIGSVIALRIEFHSTLPSISTGVYTTFMIIMLTALLTSWLVLPPHLVVRGDGTVVQPQKSLSPKQEMHEFLQLFKDWRMVALFPMFFASNYFYSYQGALTAFLFNGRTRALVSLLTGLGSMIGSLMIGYLTDVLPFTRRNRALTGCFIIFISTCIIWGSGIGFQVQFTRSDTKVLHHSIPWDWTTGVSVGPILLLFAYYIVDASFQGLAYYTMSSMSNEPFKLARMAGYYKGIQSAGAAVSFGMDAVKTPFIGEILISSLLIILSLPLAAYVIWSIRDTNYDIENIQYAEDAKSQDCETVQPVHLETRSAKD
ncbi:hypothetical protein N5P37_010036 [Trichoderma harzianum]|nr:hypothetical protein N5P37_010036 [Trichoderma harzianum]